MHIKAAYIVAYNYINGLHFKINADMYLVISVNYRAMYLKSWIMAVILAIAICMDNKSHESYI